LSRRSNLITASNSIASRTERAGQEHTASNTRSQEAEPQSLSDTASSPLIYPTPHSAHPLHAMNAVRAEAPQQAVRLALGLPSCAGLASLDLAWSGTASVAVAHAFTRANERGWSQPCQCRVYARRLDVLDMSPRLWGGVRLVEVWMACLLGVQHVDELDNTIRVLMNVEYDCESQIHAATAFVAGHPAAHPLVLRLAHAR
jgi:hypothetical protein